MKSLNKCKQLHVVYSISVEFGGLGSAALRFSQSAALAGSDVYLFVINRSDNELLYDSTHGEISIVGCKRSGFFGHTFELLDFCNKHSFEIIHIHGTWSPFLGVASFIALLKNIPLIISPHGCLEPWALNHKSWKKKLALAFYQKWIFSNASLFVATATQELSSIRNLGLKQPIAVIPNGVDIPIKFVKCQNRSLRKFLFLSRIHPIKGLLDLVHAWAKVRQPGWTFVIAGPDENGHRAEVEKLINTMGLKNDFEFIGLVTGEKKESIYANADIFILPTYSENFGLVIAEALAREIPVITTTGAPWKELEDKCCGWWVKPGVEGIAAGLVDAMAKTPSELCEMGRRGRHLIDENYCWEMIGVKALLAYEWVLNQNAYIPEFVNTDS